MRNRTGQTKAQTERIPMAGTCRTFQLIVDPLIAESGSDRENILVF